jgi:hypothetical protein
MCSSQVCAIGTLILGILLLPGCNAINPLCGSARPSPVLTSIAPTSVSFAEVQKTFQLSVTGSHFVSASVIVVNGIQVSTNIPSSTQLSGTVSTAAIPTTGTYKVYVSTPAGNSGNLGCTSGGKSSSVTLTVN